MTSALDRTRSLAEVIDQVSARLAVDPLGAQRGAEEILRHAPDDPRALLILASARRRQGDLAAARSILEPLAKAWPRAAVTQYELGLVLGLLGETTAAIAALRRAVGLRRDLAEAWSALGEALFASGDARGAQAAFAEHDRACVTDPALRDAAEAVYRGDWALCERLLRAHLTTRPDDPIAHRLLAQAAIGQARDTEAETLLARCLELDPAYDGARFLYANLLFRRQKAGPALSQIERLLGRSPADAAYRNLYAACLALAGEHARAIEIYQGLVAQFPLHPHLWLNLGHALRTLGRRSGDAVAAYRRCLALAPGMGEACWSLANLKTVVFGPEDRATMVSQRERADITDEDRLYLDYALGKALEDAGDWSASFAHYQRGATRRRAQATYDADQTSAWVARAKATFTPDLLATRMSSGRSKDAPIFIVGLPRSGSTLIEQILASHSAVEGTQELPDIPAIAASVGVGYPEALAGLTPRALAEMGDAYLEGARIHRRLGRPFFVDKMPNNFLHIGLITLILPQARIIDARRHPMGAGFSAFKQYFAQGHAFSYDLADLGRYYRDYVDLMAHYDAVLPGRVHRVVYEDMVEDTEIVVRRLLDYCGLPFEAACLRFHETDRAVRTVSSEQVRQPIYRGGLDQWRRYETWLGPLKVALGETLENWRGEAR